MSFPLRGLDIVAKDPMMDGRRPELTRLALFSVARWFLLRNWWHLQSLYIFCESNCVLFLHDSGVDEGCTDRILVVSLWTRLRVRMESGYTESSCRASSLGLVFGSSVRGRGIRWMSLVIWRGGSDQMCGDSGLSGWLTIDGRPECVSLFVDHADLVSMYSMGHWCDHPR